MVAELSRVQNFSLYFSLKWCHSQSDFTDHMSDWAKARKPWGKYTLKRKQFPLDHTPDAQHLLRMNSLSLVKWKHFVNCFGLFWSNPPILAPFSVLCSIFISIELLFLVDSGAEDCFA